MTNAAGAASLNLGPQDAGVYEVRAEALCGCLVTEATVTVKAEESPLPPGPDPECPAVQIGATAHQGNSITIEVTTNATFDLMRTSGIENLNVGTFEGDAQFVDTDTVVGMTYTYTVLVDGLDCGSIEVTAIPVFPGAVAAGLAASIGLLAYVGMRRRW